MSKRRFWSVRMLIVGIAVGFTLQSCKKSGELKAIQTQRADDLVITLLSEAGDLKQGKNDFVLEFNSASTQQPVDVGRVSISSTMQMPGMAPMSAGIALSPTGERGRYRASATFEMSGAWQFSIDWDGPAGKGSSLININVR